MEIKVPHLGDGIDSATVLSLTVSVGDTVSKDDTIIELETDKAVAPVPSPESGVVSAITVKEGDTVSSGTSIGALSGAAGNGDASASDSAPAATTAPVSSPTSPVQSAPVTTQTAPQGQFTYVSTTGQLPPTSPSIRRFSALSGLDLGRIQGSGSGGRITWADVQSYVAYIQSMAFNAPESPVVGTTAPSECHQVTQAPLSQDFSKWGEVDIQSIPGIRKKISENLRQTWQVTPHVTQFDEADVTDLMALRKKYNPKYEKQGAKLTLTVFTIKAVYEALRQFPQFNASFDESTGQLILKKYHHMGIAVDTENGLMVPVIRDIGNKTILELVKDLNELADKARDRKVSVDDMQGASFTISNLGGLGVGAFTPIVNAPDVAILGLGRGQMKPKFDKKGAMTPRLMMPVCLSYDHRVIDGADGARFTRAIIDQLEAFPEALLKEL